MGTGTLEQTDFQISFFVLSFKFRSKPLAMACRMNVIARLPTLCRNYSSLPPKLPTPTLSKLASSPQQVIIRRTLDSTIDYDQDKARYNLLRAKGDLDGLDGSVPSYTEWLERTNRRRRRVRGTRVKKVVTTNANGEETETQLEEVVGRRIYLPNIVIRMMRNHTPPGQPYNPYEATFRIPPSLTKLDVRAYLKAVYGVECTYIRTDNYIAPIVRNFREGNQLQRMDGKNKTYKRAVVGLVKPFVYPEASEDMSLAEREKRKEWLEEVFQTDAMEDQRKTFNIGMWTGNFKSYRNTTTKRGTILANVMKRRVEKEDKVKQAVQNLVASGASPFGAGSLGQKVSAQQ